MGNKRLLVLMVSLILFFVLFGLTLSREKITGPEKFLRDTVAWTQSLFNRPARFVADVVQDIRDIRTLYAENKTLRLTLTQYARDTMKLNELEAQNLRLKDLLGFTEKQKAANNYKYHPAEVTAYSSDPYSKVITVNVGARDGVKKDMAVISIDGLVGRVMDTADFTSNVQLLTAIDSVKATDSASDKAETSAPTKAISATVKGKESDSFGVVSYDPDSGLLVMSKISPSDPIAKGDTIITSGIGGVFPKGIVIGTVLSKEVDKLGINYIAYVQPAADFIHLREVLIVEIPE